MSRTIHNCEFCGDEIPPTVKYYGDVIVCGRRECRLYETSVYRERDADARERADADNYDAYR
jgi:hypothetical protein